MDSIVVTGGNKLNGVIPISGAKNATLPLMIASLLSSQPLILQNVPHLADVESLIRILTNHGVDYRVEGKRRNHNGQQGRNISFRAEEIVDTTAPYELVSKMRASFWVIGPLLARMHVAKVSLPGGCAIGTRPVDMFLESLTALGAKIEIENGYAIAEAPGGLVGVDFTFNKVSVGATHVALMASTLAKGKTILRNCAREPEIGDLANCLNAMGAKISGIGSGTLTIEGVEELHGATHTVLPDRIETGTYAMAVAMTGGDVLLKGARPDDLRFALDLLVKAGVGIEETNEGLRVTRNGAALKPVDVGTEPFPGFPTDLQAQFMALMTMADGESRITENIFENRFMHVQELVRLGANIDLEGKTAVIKGPCVLTGAQVMATDLRASVSLVIAGLVADGDTTVNRVYHLDRGFEHLEEKLTACGAKIERVSS